MAATRTANEVVRDVNVPVGSKSHPSYEPLKEILTLYPRQSAPLFHSYTDLVHAARWEDVIAVDLGIDTSKPARLAAVSGSGWAGLVGKRPAGKKLEAVVPCHVTDTLSTSFFDSIYFSLGSLSSQERFADLETEHILLAVLSPDSTVVYYKLAKGLVKPVN